MKRFLMLLSLLLLCFQLVLIPASAATITVVPGIGKVGANTSNSTHNYSAHWQYWCQGASKYQKMRDCGCRVVAQAKLLVEVGAVSADTNTFNPDIYLEWGMSQGYWPYAANNINEQTATGKAAIAYAANSGVTLTQGYVGLSGGNNATDVQTVMNYINAGYYVILHSNAHQAYVGRTASLNAGTPVILDSWYTNSYTPNSCMTYSGYTLVYFTGMYYYAAEGGTNTTPINLGDSFYASISRTDAPSELLSVPEAIDGTVTFAAAANQSTQQRWQFIRQADGSYKIRSVHSDYVLNVDNGSSAEGTLATVWKDLGNNHQLWYIYETDGGYRLTAKSTGKSLTIYPASDGQNATLNAFSGSPAQTLNIHVHNYQAIPVAPECTKDGYTLHDCAGCDDYYTINDGAAATDHIWNETGSIPATCQQTGSIIYTCEGCGETRIEPAETIWSGWSEIYPNTIAPDRIDAKVQYRFRERVQNWAETETGTISYVPSWPSGFQTSHSLYTQYNNTPKVTSETQTEKVTVLSDQIEGYLYYHWCRGTYTTGPINRLISDVAEGNIGTFHAFYSTTTAGHSDANGVYVADAFYYPNAGCCTDSYWFFQLPVNQQSYSIETLQFSGERWTDWSAWSDAEITATDSRQVETRTLYRYVTEGLGEHSWVNGVCSLCSAAKPEAPFLMGDANDDGYVNNVDAMLVLQYTVGLNDGADLNVNACDVGGDGKINNVDAMMILQYAVGLITSFK